MMMLVLMVWLVVRCLCSSCVSWQVCVLLAFYRCFCFGLSADWEALTNMTQIGD